MNVETVRYYQRRSLMPRPGRYYAPEQLARLRRRALPHLPDHRDAQR